jgi:hypothetical protein
MKLETFPFNLNVKIVCQPDQAGSLGDITERSDKIRVYGYYDCRHVLFLHHPSFVTEKKATVNLPLFQSWPGRL